MAAWNGYLYPIPEMYQQSLTTSLAIDLARFSGYQLVDKMPTVIMGVWSHTGSTALVSHNDGAAYVFPTYADDLFNHWLFVPEKLSLGNLLSNQTRQIEIANLYLTPQSIATVTNNGGLGVALTGVPVLPASVRAFDSVTVSVSVSTEGPPSINGTIDFTFTGSPAVSVPVTGTRVTMFPWQPEVPVNETLEWVTDIMTSANDTEQRASILLAARQRIGMSIVQDDPVQWQKMHNVVFDWMPRVWGVPIWWEQRRLSAAVTAGANSLLVDTTYGDFRNAGLVMIISTVDGSFEAFEIDSSTGTQINLTSFVQNNYTAADMVMPVRTAYLSSVPSGTRKLNNMEQLNVEFLTLDNIDMSDITGASLLNGLVVLDDPNSSGDSLAETWSRAVTVIDGKSGRVFQSTLIDRSRMHTKKTWKLNSMAEMWRVRKLLHSFRGSMTPLFLPTYRQDFVLAQDISGSGTSFRVKNNGYTQFAQARAPMNFVRVLFNDGTYVIRQITGSSEDGAQELIVINAAFSGSIIPVSSVKRLELVILMRIEDDKATMQHSSAGVSSININVVSTKG